MKPFKRDFKLAPSILSADFGNLEREIAQLDPDLVDYLHLDIMDGHFVPNITIGPTVVEAIHQLTSIPLDVHLMISQPECYLKDFARAGASILTVHAEACPHLHRSLQQIRELDVKAGVSLNPATSLNSLSHVLNELDLVLLMTVNPGFGGQKFIADMIPKIRECRKMIENYPIELEVDGGIKLNNIQEIAKAGAHVFVSGSGIFKAPPYNETIQKMRESLG